MKTKTNSLVNGVAFLAIAGILVKILGLVCKIPLVHIIDEEGMGYFNSAYAIYNVFFMLSNAGLPVAISIIISEQVSKDVCSRCAGTFRLIFRAVLVVGGIGFLLLMCFAESLADFVGNPPAALCILVMAPVFFFVCISGGLRGYFQGLSRMMPTGISQLIEALAKTVLGIGLSLYGVKKGYPLSVCAALALTGIAIGGLLSTVYLLLLARVNGAFSVEKKPLEDSSSPKKSIVLKRLIAIAFPVSLGSVVLSLTNFMDLAVVMRGLQAGGVSAEMANRMYGNYTGLAIPLFNLPPVLIMPIAYAIVPVISSARIAKDDLGISVASTGALKAASVITLPCVFGLLFFSQPILEILFENEASQRAAPMLSVLAPAIFFVGIVSVTGSILQAMGKQIVPVISMLCGGVVKLAVSLLLIPRVGLLGAPIGTLCCYVVIAMINLIYCIRFCHLRLQFLSQFWFPMAAAMGSATLGFGVQSLLEGHLPKRLISVMTIAFICFIYVILLFVLRIIEDTEIEILPLPKPIKAFLRRACVKRKGCVKGYEKCKGTKGFV